MTALYTIRTNCSATVDLEIIMEIEAEDDDDEEEDDEEEDEPDED